MDESPFYFFYYFIFDFFSANKSYMLYFELYDDLFDDILFKAIKIYLWFVEIKIILLNAL